MSTVHADTNEASFWVSDFLKKYLISRGAREHQVVWQNFTLH